MNVVMYLLHWSANSPNCRSCKVLSQKCSKLVEVFKIGQITPLLKKTWSPHKRHYRPIANLNTVSNILERLANKQLQKHLPLSSNVCRRWMFINKAASCSKANS